MSNGAGGAFGAGAAIVAAVGYAYGRSDFYRRPTPAGRIVTARRMRESTVAAKKWPVKDPDEIEDFVLDWTDRLAGDSIASSLWVVPAGITMDDEYFDNNVTLGGLPNRYGTTIWLSGGTLGETYTFVNRIMTTGGRTYDQSVKLRVKTR